MAIRYACFLPLAASGMAAGMAAGEETRVREWPLLPEAISSFGATAADGAIYVYGGHVGRAHAHSRDNLRGDLRRLAPGDASWTTLASGPPLQGTALVAFETSLFRVGGLS